MCSTALYADNNLQLCHEVQQHGQMVAYNVLHLGLGLLSAASADAMVAGSMVGRMRCCLCALFAGALLLVTSFGGTSWEESMGFFLQEQLTVAFTMGLRM